MKNLLLILTFATASFLAAQESKEVQPTCHVGGFLKPEGWDVPGLEGAKPGGVDQKLTADYQAREGSAAWTVRAMIPGTHYGTAPYFFCSSKFPGVLTVSERTFPIGMWRGEIKGRVYSYCVGGNWVILNKDGGVTHLGGVSSWCYFDLDGNGKFEVMSEGGDVIPKPEWVKRLEAEDKSSAP